MSTDISQITKHSITNVKSENGSKDFNQEPMTSDNQDRASKRRRHHIRRMRRALTFRRSSGKRKHNNKIPKSSSLSDPEFISQRASRSSSSSSISSLSLATSSSYSSHDSEASNKDDDTNNPKVRISSDSLPKARKTDRGSMSDGSRPTSSKIRFGSQSPVRRNAELLSVHKPSLFSRFSFRKHKSSQSSRKSSPSSKKSSQSLSVQDNSSTATCQSSNSLTLPSNCANETKKHLEVHPSNTDSSAGTNGSQRKYSVSLSLSKLKRRTKSLLLLNGSSSSLLDLAKAGKAPSDSLSNSIGGEPSGDSSNDGTKATLLPKEVEPKFELGDIRNSTHHSNVSYSSSVDPRESTSHESNRSSLSFSVKSCSRKMKKRSQTIGPTERRGVLKCRTPSSSKASLEKRISPNSDSQVVKLPIVRHKSLKQKDLPSTDGHIPSTYLDELLSLSDCSRVALLLSLTDSNFMKLTLREYIKKYFDFSSLPLDIALREFLMINQLPKEVQQIDRIIYEFGRHYSEQHSELGLDIDKCYLLTYALVILHTDRFNPNNKHKMTRWEFIDNLLSSLRQDNLYSGKYGKHKMDIEAVMKETLGYFYDNIVYQQFVRIQEEQADEAFSALTDCTKKQCLPYPSLSTIEANAATALGSRTSSTPILRRRSSFLWLQPDIDIYELICQRNIGSLKLNISFNTEFPFIGSSIMSPELKADRVSESATLFDKTEAKASKNFLSLASTSENKPNVKNIDSLRKQVCSSIDKMNISSLDRILGIVEGTACSVILKVPKAKGSFLRVQNSQILEYGPQEQESAKEYYMVRVLKFGMVSRQESTLSLKSWKKYFCILTTIGMFFFRSLSLFKMTYLPEDMMKKTLIFEEAPSSSATANLLGTFRPALTIHWDAFATRMDKSLSMDKLVNTNMDDEMIKNPLRSYTFYIYTENSRAIYMVDNLFELKLWITQINYMSALASISLPIKRIALFEAHSRESEKSEDTKDAESKSSLEETISDKSDSYALNSEITDIEKYQEVACQAAPDLDSRLKELDSSVNDSIEVLQSYFMTVQKLKLLTPLQAKTKDELLSSSKIINAKLEWLWYELTKDIEYHKVLFALKEKHPSVDV